MLTKLVKPVLVLVGGPVRTCQQPGIRLKMQEVGPREERINLAPQYQLLESKRRQ